MVTYYVQFFFSTGCLSLIFHLQLGVADLHFSPIFVPMANAEEA
jgi:hypothetical protein